MQNGMDQAKTELQPDETRSQVTSTQPIPEQMTALVRDEDGRFIKKQIETPKPGVGEVLIENLAAGVDPVDLKVLHSTGVDGVGRVVAIGPGVTGVTVGQRVIYHASLLAMKTRSGTGSFAEFAVLDEKSLVSIPDTMSDVQAATIPCPGGTAHQIFKGLATALEATNSSVRSPAVFIQGASGNVNQFLIQLLKIHFPNVAIIGSASPNKHQGLKALNVIPVPYNDGTAESADEFELSQVNQIL